MLDSNIIILVLIVIFALVFDYINGFNDSANAIATCISTRALSIRRAVLMAAVLNLVGAMVSTKVATTIGEDIVHLNNITQLVVFSGIAAAITWSLITWYFAIPSSSSHSLFGGIMGSAVAHAGFAALNWSGIKLILLALLLSPIVGLLLSFMMMVALLWTVRTFHPEKLNKNFRLLQIISAAIMAFAHGTADAQKSMAIITMGLVSCGLLDTFSVPWIVMAACALAMALGTGIGGWRIIKTVGKDFVKLQPIHGFCVQTAASGVVLAASALSLPTSTTHVITSAVLGVGLTKRLSAINWKIAQHIILAWILTIPASGILAFFAHLVFDSFLKRFFE
jgi:PiT family inorganic phosphate transporter